MALTSNQRSNLSVQGFERLLKHLGEDPDSAASEYETLRRRLLHFFDLRHAPSPEALADETFDRVSRKLEEGVAVGNLRAYLHGVAKRVLLEGGRRRAREHAALRELRLWRVQRASDDPPEVVEERLRCLELCLRELPAEDQELILGYYQGEGVAHLEGRKLLAERQGTTYGALKTRAHRIRIRLAECVRTCLGRLDSRNR